MFSTCLQLAKNGEWNRIGISSWLCNVISPQATILIVRDSSPIEVTFISQARCFLCAGLAQRGCEDFAALSLTLQYLKLAFIFLEGLHSSFQNKTLTLAVCAAFKESEPRIKSRFEVMGDRFGLQMSTTSLSLLVRGKIPKNFNCESYSI